MAHLACDGPLDMLGVSKAFTGGIRAMSNEGGREGHEQDGSKLSERSTSR